MRWVIICLFFSINSFAQESKNTFLLDHWSMDTLIANSFGVRYSECLGFTIGAEEFVVAASTEGSHFFRLTDDDEFESVGFIEGKFSNTQVIHRDYAVYQNLLYAVCDEGTSSLQIIDISNLPNSISVLAENDSTFARVHNIKIDTTNALLYACSVTPILSGNIQSLIPMQVFTLSDPLNPTLVYSGPNDIPEVHDAYIRGTIAYLNCGFDGLRVYDFEDPVNPLYIQNLNFYQDQGYNHQGALSEDGSMYLFADETMGKKIKKCSVTDNQATIVSNFGTNFQNNSVPHNISITGDFAYVAYYNEGLRIYDLRFTKPIEVASYDTYPVNEELFKLKGAWGIYSDFPSGRIVVSDRVYGLFLIDFPSEILSIPIIESISIFPNPHLSGNSFTIALSDKLIDAFSLAVYDATGRLILTQETKGQTYTEISQKLDVGIYHLKVQYPDYLGEQHYIIEKFVVH